MSRRDFKFWISFIILITVFCEGAYYYKHHAIVKKRTAIEKIVQAQRAALTAAQIAAGPVASMEIVRHDFPITLSADGVIDPSDAADIHSEIAGKVKTINFDDGESVDQDDVVIRLEPSIATTDTTKTDLTAPIDGVLSLHSLKIDDAVTPGQKLATVRTLDPMKIGFSLPEANFSDVHEGQEITFVVDALPDLFFKGEIYAIDSDVNPETHHFGLQAMATNTENKLLPGMAAHLKLITSVHQNALVIPESALVNNSVFVIEDAKAKSTPVTTGLHQDGFVEIMSGLNQGQAILISGTATIHDGSPVVVQPIDPDDSDDQPSEETTD